MNSSTKFRFHPLFCDHAVLQRGRTNRIWGWGRPEAAVSLRLLGQTSSAFIEQDGSWKIDLPPFEAQTGLELTLTSGDETLQISNLAIGEVWLCSGQSNMEWPMQFTNDSYEEIRAATDRDIRLFTVPRRPFTEPRTSLTASKWQPCSPDLVKNFSAVAYFFARKLRQELEVPIGLIHSSWGGSVIQAWLPPCGSNESEQSIKVYTELWRRWVTRECHADTGNEGESLGWAAPDFDDSDWSELELPGIWQGQGYNINGAVWARKQIDLPVHWAGRDLVLHFGRVDDQDTTYFNGEKVGGLDFRVPQSGTALRVYVVPGHLVRAGRNVVSTRIFDHAGDGGISADTSWIFSLILPSSNEQCSLAGVWRMKIEKTLPPRSPEIWNSMPRAPIDFYAQFEPSLTRASLFNGMIGPLAPYGLKGVLWYQGESNVDEAARYPDYLRDLVEGWRSWWKDDALAFVVAQLADYIDGKDEPLPKGRSPWSELREAQTTILRLPHTGLAITRDVGDAYDIHPRNKQDVGFRLALQALKNIYGKNLIAGSPKLESVSVQKGRVIARFANCEQGLRTKNGSPLLGFVVGDPKGAFFQGQARITGREHVEIEYPEEIEPATLRYAWASFSQANLENSEGLPAGPFRAQIPFQA